MHQRWISDDGRHWQPANDALTLSLSLLLPSDEHPKPGELRLSIDRKTPQRRENSWRTFRIVGSRTACWPR